MEQAVEQVEWVDRFKWHPDLKCSDDYWLPEELHGIDLVVHYGVINGQLERTDDTKHNLKVFIQSSYDFINYNKSLQFEGFDWFLSTIFLICSGNVDKLVYSVSVQILFLLNNYSILLNACFKLPQLAAITF